MRNVLITGGSRGIGAAAVRLFLEKGDRVFFSYRNSRKEAEELAKIGAVPVCADMSCEEDVQKMMETIKQTAHGIDVLINNAGIAQEKMFCDLTKSDWENMFSNNVTSCFLVTKAVLPDMIHQKSGVVLNVSSIWGEIGASCEVHYSASKAAVIGMSKALAKELAPSGIRVNCITPGMIDTEMNACYTEEEKKDITSEIPLERMGTAEDVAELFYFLSSPNAAYLTGQVIGVNGGWNI